MCGAARGSAGPAADSNYRGDVVSSTRRERSPRLADRRPTDTTGRPPARTHAKIKGYIRTESNSQ